MTTMMTMIMMMMTIITSERNMCLILHDACIDIMMSEVQHVRGHPVDGKCALIPTLSITGHFTSTVALA